MTAEETNPKPLGQSQSGHGTVAFSNPREAQRLAVGGMGRFDGRRVSLEGCVDSLKSMGGEPCWKEGLLVPRYFQWVAVAPKMGKRLEGFLSRAGLIRGVDSNCSGGHEKRPGCVKKLRNRIKPKLSGGYVSKVRRLLNAGQIIVPTFQTSGLACLQGNGNSRLLGATGRQRQPISTVNSLKTARNHL